MKDTYGFSSKESGVYDIQGWTDPILITKILEKRKMKISDYTIEFLKWLADFAPKIDHPFFNIENDELRLWVHQCQKCKNKDI